MATDGMDGRNGWMDGVMQSETETMEMMESEWGEHNGGALFAYGRDMALLDHI